jgi:hypothetical protein
MKSCQVNEYNLAVDHYKHGKFRSVGRFKIMPKEAYLKFSTNTVYVT